jgi:peptidoglycan LD-endopeptidase LytH
MRRLRTPRTLLIVLLVFAWVVVMAAPALSISKAQVDAACADSAQAKARYDEARANAEAAEQRYDAINQELEGATLRVYQFRDRIDEKEELISTTRQKVEERAVELYMNGGAPSSGVILFTSSFDAALTGQEFLSAVTSGDVASIDELDTLKKDMERIRTEWESEQARLTDLGTQAAQAADEMTSIMDAAAQAASEMSAKCRNATTQYRKEQAAALAAAAARQSGAARGLPASAIPGMICPMDSAVVHFSNTWGAPRSGGRTHKGTDIFAPMGQPEYAVESGTVRVYTNRLGGKSIWLDTDVGADFYYAHLSGWPAGLKTGDYVRKGEVVGYNGNSGNAYGGAPHLHFQIHPGGGSPVNPYFTLREVCG